jgi:DNA-binding beta-propeller fold protein YncE
VRKAVVVLLAGLLMVGCPKKNHEPDTPSVPAGPSAVGKGWLASFSSVATDPDGDSVCIRFDWGDGDTSDWSQYVASGESVSMSHIWTAYAVCSLRAQAKGRRSLTSAWSPAQAVKVTTQRLEATIQLPAGSDPVSLCFNDPVEKLYCACAGWGDGALVAIDAESHQILRTIPGLPASWWYPLVGTPDGMKLYCAIQGPDSHTTDSTVIVVDCNSDALGRFIRVGYAPSALVYCPSGNKIYCVNAGSGFGGGGPQDSTVSVIEVASDSVVATVVLCPYPDALCYNSVSDKVYVGGIFILAAIDCSTDTVTAEFPPCYMGSPGMSYSQRSNRLHYCECADTVAVVDGASDSVIAKVSLTGDPDEWPLRLCCAEPLNRVYCASHNWSTQQSRLTVIDIPTSQILRSLLVPDEPEALLYNPASNEVFCAADTVLCVIDCGRDSIVATIPVGVGGFHGADLLALNPTRNRVYVADANSSSIWVLRDSSGGLEESFRPQATDLKRRTVRKVE